MKEYNKGFTLIELLVVIAIVGLLASIVLVSLNSSRARAKDARIIADVQQMRVRAESVQNGANYNFALTANNIPAANCTSGCASGNGINTGGDVIAAQLVNDAVAQGGKIFAVTNAANTAYAIFGQLTAQPANIYFCTDSLGRATPNTGVTTTPTIACR